MKWHETRIVRYLAHGLIYYAFFRIVGFEITVIIALGQIMGEMHYKK